MKQQQGNSKDKGMNTKDSKQAASASSKEKEMSGRQQNESKSSPAQKPIRK